MNFDRRQQVEEAKAAVWAQYIRAGIDAKTEWLEGVREAESYLRPKHSGLFGSEEMNGFLQLGGEHGGMAVYVNKVGLIKSVLVPHLQPQNPKREVSARSSDAVYMALARLLELYLNYTLNEGKLSPEMRLSLSEGVTYGVGFMRVGWDPEREIHTSRNVSSLDVVVDPNARSFESARWIAIGTKIAIDQVRTHYKDRGVAKWRIKDLTKPPSPVDEATRLWESATTLDSDQVMLWEVYSKQGNGLTRGPLAPEEYKNDEDSNLFVKLDVILGHTVPLDEGEWDLPLYLDREWPIVPFIPSETLNKLWPDSLIVQALVHQKMIDLCSTLELSAVKAHGRDVYFYRSEALSPASRDMLISGGPSVAIPLTNLPAGMQASDVIYRPPLGTQPAEISRIKESHERALEVLTGVTPVLQGGQGLGPVERSATASQQQMQASNARLLDLRARVEEFSSSLARAEAISVRLAGLIDASDVQAVIGDLALGWRIDVPGGLPLRGPGSIETVAPIAATYFETEEQATTLVGEVWAGLLASMQKKPFRKLVGDLLLAGGSHEALPPGIVARRVTAADVFRDTAGLSPRDLMRELSYSIATGTTVRQDPAGKQAYAERLLQGALPTAMRMGDVNAANVILERADDAYDVPPGERGPRFQPPPPPPPAPGAVSGGPPSGGGGGP